MRQFSSGRRSRVEVVDWTKPRDQISFSKGRFFLSPLFRIFSFGPVGWLRYECTRPMVKELQRRQLYELRIEGNATVYLYRLGPFEIIAASLHWQPSVATFQWEALYAGKRQLAKASWSGTVYLVNWVKLGRLVKLGLIGSLGQFTYCYFVERVRRCRTSRDVEKVRLIFIQLCSIQDYIVPIVNGIVYSQGLFRFGFRLYVHTCFYLTMTGNTSYHLRFV